ncbi:MAG: hypothetical protein EOO10_24765 [Chitinophagaceae bacterium]|nr:MAG: hypothetical protein EOO10_24765 [Chitinophagaceae bacterium]
MRLLFVGLLLTIASTFVSAQIPTDPGGTPDNTQVPFDGGLSLVVAAGIAYVAKKGYEKRKGIKQE